MTDEDFQPVDRISTKNSPYIGIKWALKSLVLFNFVFL